MTLKSLASNMDLKTPDPEISPLNPPDAYHPPGSDNIALEQMHPFLRKLSAEHEAMRAALGKFERTILGLKSKGVTQQIHGELKDFFVFFNDTFIPHAKIEEKTFFPVLDVALRKKRGQSFDLDVTTAVDMMEDDHLKAIQLTAVVFNFFALAARLGNQISRDLVMDAALESADQLIELLRLHIFREETIVFPLAHRLITTEELDCLVGLIIQGEHDDTGKGHF